MAISVDAQIPLGVKSPQIESPLQAYSQVLGVQNQQQQQREGAQKIESNDIELQNQKRAQAYQQTFTDSLQKHTTKNPDGTLVTDWGGIQGDITNAGYGPEALKLSGERAAAQEAGLKLLHEQNQANLDKVQSVGRVLGALPQVDQTATPDVQAIQKSAWGAAAPNAVASLVAQGHMSQQDGAAMIKQIQDAGGWTPQFDALVKQKQMEGLTSEQQIQHVQNGVKAAQDGDVSKATIAHLKAETDASNATAAEKALSSAAAKASQLDTADKYDAYRATLRPEVAAGLPDSKDIDFTNPESARQTILRSGMTAEQVAANEGTKKLSDNTVLALRAQGQTTGNSFIDKMTPKAAAAALERVKPPAANTSISLGASGTLTPDDIKREGEIYARTGKMPNLGMGSAEVKKAVIHQGNEFARSMGLSPGEVVTMQAAYAGDKSSLQKFQSQRDQIGSFEKTAGKNIDQFLDLASKVPDSGSPWINKPMREINDKALGSSDIAALNAARAVATNEIAKVTSGGGLGGILSDAARQEVKDYNPQSATFAQTKKVVQVLKNDMNNRMSSMDDTLSDIRSRIGGAAPSSTAAATAVGTEPISPDWKAQAKAAKAGDIIPLPNGHKVQKLSDGTFKPLTQ